MKFLIFSSLLFIKFAALPNTNLLLWMFIAIGVDFITGVIKAVFLKKARTSQGYRKTVIKFVQYGGALAVGIILQHAAGENGQAELKSLIAYFNDALVVFLILVEVASIFENLAAIDQKSPVAKFFILPIHRLLTVQIKKGPGGLVDMKMPNHPPMPNIPPGPMAKAPIPTEAGAQ